MVNERWYKFFRNTTPDSNYRLNPCIGFFKSQKALKKSIFKNPLKMAINAVHDIANKYPEPYSIMASGGIDSQAMIYAWEKSGIPYTAYHYTYDHWNSMDSDSMREFTALNGLDSKVVYKNFKVLDFLESTELERFAVEFDCSSPQILTHCALLDQTPGTVVLAGNFLNGMKTHLNYTIFGLQRYSEKCRPNMVPFFFIHTPELAYSFYKIEQSVVGDDKPQGDEEYYRKFKTYQKAGFNIVPQKDKLTGFEKIKDHYDDCKVDPGLRLRYKSQISKRPFDYLFRYKLYDKIGLYSERTIFIYDDIIQSV